MYFSLGAGVVKTRWSRSGVDDDSGTAIRTLLSRRKPAMQNMRIILAGGGRNALGEIQTSSVSAFSGRDCRSGRTTRIKQPVRCNHILHGIDDWRRHYQATTTTCCQQLQDTP